MDSEGRKHVTGVLRGAEKCLNDRLECSVPDIINSNILIGDHEQVLAQCFDVEYSLLLLVGELLLYTIHMHFATHQAQRIFEVQHLLV